MTHEATVHNSIFVFCVSIDLCSVGLAFEGSTIAHESGFTLGLSLRGWLLQVSSARSCPVCFDGASWPSAVFSFLRS